jgi:hypothetical protein
MFAQPKFHILYDNWKRLDFQKDYIPSADRKKDSIGYTMDNIQLMTWAENNAKGNVDMRSGKLTHGVNPQKTVIQYTMSGEFVANFVSVSEASRQTGIHHSRISACCRGERNETAGFVWKYKKGK